MLRRARSSRGHLPNARRQSAPNDFITTHAQAVGANVATATRAAGFRACAWPRLDRSDARLTQRTSRCTSSIRLWWSMHTMSGGIARSGPAPHWRIEYGSGAIAQQQQREWQQEQEQLRLWHGHWRRTMFVSNLRLRYCAPRHRLLGTAHLRHAQHASTALGPMAADVRCTHASIAT